MLPLRGYSASDDLALCSMNVAITRFMQVMKVCLPVTTGRLCNARQANQALLLSLSVETVLALQLATFSGVAINSAAG